VRTKFFWVLAACWILFFALVFGLVLFPTAVPFFLAYSLAISASSCHFSFSRLSYTAFTVFSAWA
jgi:hypothetical protein